MCAITIYIIYNANNNDIKYMDTILLAIPVWNKILLLRLCVHKNM